MLRYLSIIRMPLIVLIFNALIYHFINIGFVGFGPILFNFIRIITVIWAAWLLVDKEVYSIVSASLVGPFFLFIDHVVLGGGLGLLTTDFSQIHLNGEENLLFENVQLSFLAGIIISFLMFFPVAMLFGVLGGYMAKNGSKNEPT